MINTPSVFAESAKFEFAPAELRARLEVIDAFENALLGYRPRSARTLAETLTAFGLRNHVIRVTRQLIWRAMQSQLPQAEKEERRYVSRVLFNATRKIAEFSEDELKEIFGPIIQITTERTRADLSRAFPRKMRRFITPMENTAQTKQTSDK